MKKYPKGKIDGLYRELFYLRDLIKDPLIKTAIERYADEKALKVLILEHGIDTAFEWLQDYSNGCKYYERLNNKALSQELKKHLDDQEKETEELIWYLSEILREYKKKCFPRVAG